MADFSVEDRSVGLRIGQVSSDLPIRRVMRRKEFHVRVFTRGRLLIGPTIKITSRKEPRPRGIESLDIVGRRLEVIDQGILIADIPDDDTGMVAVAHHRPMGPRQQGSQQRGIVQKVVPESGRYFIQHIETGLITEVQKAWVRGIVTTTDAVDIGLLHQIDIQTPVRFP